MRTCELCSKTSRMGGTRKLLRGHYNPTNWTRKYPNLQRTRIPAGGFMGIEAGTRVLVCSNCIRNFSKPARMAKKVEVKKAAKAKAEAAKAAAAANAKPEAKKEKKAAPKKKEAKKSAK